MNNIKKRISVIITQLRRDMGSGLDEDGCEHYLDKLNGIKDELDGEGHTWISELDDIEIEEDAVDEDEEDYDDYEPTYEDTASEILEQLQDIQHQLQDEEPEKVVEKPAPAQVNNYHINKHDSHDTHQHEAEERNVVDSVMEGVGSLHKIGGVGLVLLGGGILMLVLVILFKDGLTTLMFFVLIVIAIGLTGLGGKILLDNEKKK